MAKFIVGMLQLSIQNYIRNFSTEDIVVYHAMDSKSIKALESLDFLKRYAGILVHDHETALYHFGTDHGCSTCSVVGIAF